jgi:TatD DNase family protein
MVDSHCHLGDEGFGPDLEAVVERARAAGVRRALVVLEAGNRSEAERAALVEELWPETRIAVGVHPHLAPAYADDPAVAAAVVLRHLSVMPTARAVGEIGLDYHYHQDPATLAAQRAVFRAQLRLARERRLPVVIHSREADEDMLAILKQEGQGAIRGVLHCFTGSQALASGALDLGFHISFAGIVTFPKASHVLDIATATPLDRLLTETDCPYLAPVPHRGKRNEPAFVERVVARIAERRGMPADQLASRTVENFDALFEP